ncbi:hypothetical protein [Metapseudomonas resinovorans]|uniref:Uncharacterized protein n=1 Tax=Metapseudomonas resinovorans NBRC 106553 TaxID=1245471 RepID=S6AEC2_METRE|nr:hypothetical protein [Pseudomonas resinovorans]BAN47947.1 hypothetical protein PCA10_22150 [Pseudomonas resinovorans NBRC 106553]BAN49192.1 hypothetical protein PCA10_34600 [Pseudomonas resinovorans NBRC 106553]
MTEELEERRLRELVNRLDSRLEIVQVLAEILLDNATLRPCVPGAYLNYYREGMLMEAVIHLARSNQEDFGQLMKRPEIAVGLDVS